MNLKALITTLVLGTSSAAIASPAPSVKVSAEASFRFGTRPQGPVVRDHRVYRAPTDRAPAPGWTRPGHQQRFDNIQLNGTSSSYIGPVFPLRGGYGWTPMTESTQIRNTRQMITLNTSVHALALQATSGSSQISLVKVLFADGRTQSISVNGTLSNSSTIYLNVNQGQIQYITVYGTMTGNASYRLLGS